MSKVASHLVLGIDGGGTSTIAFLADANTGAVLGRGTAGPSNIQSVGVEAGLAALNACIGNAFAEAKLPRTPVAAAVLGLAGIDRQEGLDVIHAWAQSVNLSPVVQVANDATLLLAAGTPEGWGLAVIAGTGSIAFVRSKSGEIGRCGGWGYLMGDEGSGYQIAVAALRAACRSFDGILPKTLLVPRLIAAMQLREVPDFIPAVYRDPRWSRSAIAGLAPLVMQAAEEGDGVAAGIVRTEARELARTAVAAVRNNGLLKSQIPVALAGGVLTKSECYREEFICGLEELGVEVGSVQLVTEPALGAVTLARSAIQK